MDGKDRSKWQNCANAMIVHARESAKLKMIIDQELICYRFVKKHTVFRTNEFEKENKNGRVER